MAKGKSPQKQKQIAWRKRPYTTMQLAFYEFCECDGARGIPSYLLDKAADEKLTGGFNTKRNNICAECFQARSTNGKCGCKVSE
jgi:hypothetical protein